MYEMFSLCVSPITFWCGNLFKSCFDWHLRSVGENAILRLLYATSKSFNCVNASQKWMCVRVRVFLCIFLGFGAFWKSKLCEWMAKQTSFWLIEKLRKMDQSALKHTFVNLIPYYDISHIMNKFTKSSGYSVRRLLRRYRAYKSFGQISTNFLPTLKG